MVLSNATMNPFNLWNLIGIILVAVITSKTGVFPLLLACELAFLNLIISETR